MVHHINRSPVASLQLTWQSLLWRLILTGLLLLVLAGSGMTFFHNALTRPEARVLPTLTYDTDAISTDR